MSKGYWEQLIEQQVDGPTLTAAAAASCIAPAAKKAMWGNFFEYIGKQLIIEASGKISCAVTTPGTARFDIRWGGTVVFDGLAVPLNIIAQTNVPFKLRIVLTCRAIGTSANLEGEGEFYSRAIVGTPAAGTGPIGCELLPYNTAPTVGANFDSTTAGALDMFFTQNVATGSLTVLQYQAISPN